jgi:hypothetical protein
MAVTEKVEIGFDLTTAGGPFLTLNDPVAGQLDNPAWPLGGLTFYDITSRVRSYSIRRGKSRQLDTFQAGVASVVLNNNDRAFDPTFTASPFYGQVVPKREIRISSNSVVQYRGLIDDWNLDYAPQGDSTALAASSDGFSQLANQTLTGGTATLQLTGARINSILSSTDVEWPAETRSIDSGEIYLGADVIPVDANALTYLQTIERSEGGRFFIGKNGYVTYKDQNGVQPSSATMVTLADDATGIKYTGMQVVYGSELLYNQVVASSIVAGGTAIANDTDSQQAYGVQTLTYTDLISAYNADVDALAVNLVKQYSAPEFRFEAVTINLDEITTTEANQVLDLEIGSVCNIKFTPNGIAPAIQKYAEVISISHSADVRKHSVTLGFSTLDYIGLILNDAVFGKLNTAAVG